MANERRGYGKLRGNPHFPTLLLAQAAGDIGQGLFGVVLSWYVLEQGGPAMLGLFVSARCLPYLVFSALAGAVSDRVDRRRSMIFADCGAGLAAAAIPALAWAGCAGAWPAVALGFAFDTLREFSSVARRSLVPRIVARDAYVSAVSLNSVTFRLGGMVGAGIVGPLSRTFGLVNLCAIVAACLFLAAAFAWSLRAPRSLTAGANEMRPDAGANAARGDAGRPGIGRAVASDLTQGFKSAFRNPYTRIIFSLDAAYFAFAHGPLMVGLPMLVKELGGDAGALGFLQAAGAGASLLVVLVAGQYMGAASSGAMYVGGWFGFAAGILAVGIAPTMGLATAAYAVQQSLGFFIPLSSQVIIRDRVPPDDLGKAFGVWDTIAPGLGVVSAPLAGLAAQVWPVTALFFVGGGISMINAVIARRSAVWRGR